ncbi:hypothetical protein [Micromonospora sp. NPDC049645]|uniref:hypothetical protein n=1 Tax=Micromonospora sp. NPDC049645 TaxID=3155508 RepID=UPI0034456750
MDARERLIKSLNALITHLDSGGIQDTALPGTPAAEAIRLLKNGLSVSAFACFEHFIRGRISELLRLVSTADDRPPFDQLPKGLQIAATKGVVEAVRFRLSQRGEGLDTPDIVALAQSHADAIASSRSNSYSFSDWTFGWSTSNVGAGTLRDFLAAVDAVQLYDQIGDTLREVGFDFAAAGLANGSVLKLGRIAAWRHEAAHDSTISVDAALLRTRVIAYISVAFAFDLLASLAVAVLINGFASGASASASRSGISVNFLGPSGDKYQLQDRSGGDLGNFYGIAHCQDHLGKRSLPSVGAVVMRSSQGHIVDWFFH